ncbi:MAG: acetoin utilization protein AcuC [Thermodesulfobacteriota bacterium]
MIREKAFLYTDKYYQYDYGPHHPLRIERLKLTFDLMKAYGLLDLPETIMVETEPATQAEIETFHRRDYIEVLKRCSLGTEYDYEAALAYGLGPGDNPVFRGLWEWSLLTTGATLQAGRLVAEGRAGIGFNIAGGLHHAMPQRASGFCYVNDIAVAIKDLLRRGLRVVYVDLDAHHGDGVQAAFYDTDEVLTISLHQHGRTLFPGTGFVYETGQGRGQGFSVNLPLYPGTDDELFLEAFDPLVPELITSFQPDLLVTQLGVDALRTDPLTDLCLTNNGFITAVRKLKELDLPWLALGGGGYNLVNVARAWTLAWALMNDLEPPDDLPESFLNSIRPYGYREEKLRDNHWSGADGRNRAEAGTVVRQMVDSIRRTILPVVSRSRPRSW